LPHIAAFPTKPAWLWQAIGWLSGYLPYLLIVIAAIVAAKTAPQRKLLSCTLLGVLIAVVFGVVNYAVWFCGGAVDFPGLNYSLLVAALSLPAAGLLSALTASWFM